MVCRWFAGAALIGTLACTVDRSPSGPPGADTPLGGPGRPRVEALMAAAGIPGLAAARVGAGGEVRLVALGVRDARTAQPLTTDTRFPAPILSDPLLGIATLDSVAEGTVGLGTRVGDSAVLAILSRTAAPLEPRRTILAPASGSEALAGLLARVAGTPVPHLLEVVVLNPLGLTDTRPSGTARGGSAATGHDLIGLAVDPAAGGLELTTTIADLARLVRELLDPVHLDRALVSQLLSPRTPLADRLAWGLGLGLERQGRDWGFWLAGQGDGFTCLLAGSPARRRGAAVLTNSDNGLAIAAELLTELMGGDHPVADWLPVERWGEAAFPIRRRLVSAGVHDGVEGLGAVLADLELSYGPLELSEALLNRVGYDLLGRGLAREAVVVLRRNAELYPMSWNVYDSLGEALAAAGEPAAAAASYRRSLELNPDNGNARRWLDRFP